MENCRPQVKGVPLAAVTIQEHLSSVLPGQKNREVPAEARKKIAHTEARKKITCVWVSTHIHHMVLKVGTLKLLGRKQPTVLCQLPVYTQKTAK